jgi:lysozyme
MSQGLIDRLKRFEGFRRYAYECSEGKLTIGYGTMIERGGHGVPERIAELLLIDYAEQLTKRFDELEWFQSLDQTRREAVIEMAYQMGYDGVLGFKRMIAAIKAEDWGRVHKEALDSRWAKQTPARAGDVAERLAYGRTST